MRMLFLTCLLGFAIGGVVTYLTEPELRSDVPILYWTGGADPIRFQQIELFEQYLLRTGRVTQGGRPVVDLRLDTTADSMYKRMIQGVSGAASDILTGTIAFMQKSGMLWDISEVAGERGLSPDRTYPSARHDFMVDDRQFGFTTRLYSVNLWVNLDTFAAYEMEPPPREWDVETFERIGQEFVRRANLAGERQPIFFVNSVQNNNGQRFVRTMHRDMGLSDFNETLTACTLDDDRYAEVLQRIYRWTYELHLMPTAADETSFNTEGSFSSSMLPLFVKGTYAMVPAGRTSLVRMREFKLRPRLGLSYFPCNEFLNCVSVAQTAGIYANSRIREKALLFLEYLTSPEWNEIVVERAQGMPPIPAYTQTEAFLRPPDYPNEWGLHEALAEAATTYAIARPHCPFISLEPTQRFKNLARDKVLAGLLEPREAASEAAERINAEIQRTIGESVRLRKLHMDWVALQDKIEHYRREERPVPLSWIKNPFHRRYYLAQEWAYPDN